MLRNAQAHCRGAVPTRQVFFALTAILFVILVAPAASADETISIGLWQTHDESGSWFYASRDDTDAVCRAELTCKEKTFALEIKFAKAEAATAEAVLRARLQERRRALERERELMAQMVELLIEQRNYAREQADQPARFVVPVRKGPLGLGGKSYEVIEVKKD